MDHDTPFLLFGADQTVKSICLMVPRLRKNCTYYKVENQRNNFYSTTNNILGVILNNFRLYIKSCSIDYKRDYSISFENDIIVQNAK